MAIFTRASWLFFERAPVFLQQTNRMLAMVATHLAELVQDARFAILSGSSVPFLDLRQILPLRLNHHNQMLLLLR